MRPLSIIATVVHALVLPVFVEFRDKIDKLWDVLIRIQNYLIELANKYLWPFVAEFLTFINFKSIKQLYNDLNDGVKKSDQCVQEFIARSGSVEYVFIMTTSTLLLVTLVQYVAPRLYEFLLMAQSFRDFKKVYPVSCEVWLYTVIGLGLYHLYSIVGFVTRSINKILNSNW